MELPRDEDGQLSAWAWPGGYPIYYFDAENSVLCVNCARRVEAEGLEVWDQKLMPCWVSINYEDPNLYCDECGGRIESAYAED